MLEGEDSVGVCLQEIGGVGAEAIVSWDRFETCGMVKAVGDGDGV